MAFDVLGVSSTSGGLFWRCLRPKRLRLLHLATTPHSPVIEQPPTPPTPPASPSELQPAISSTHEWLGCDACGKWRLVTKRLKNMLAAEKGKYNFTCGQVKPDGCDTPCESCGSCGEDEEADECSCCPRITIGAITRRVMDIWIMDNGGTERLTLAVRRTCAAAADHLNMKAHPGMSRAAKYKFWAQVGKYELA